MKIETFSQCKNKGRLKLFLASGTDNFNDLEGFSEEPPMTAHRHNKAMKMIPLRRRGFSEEPPMPARLAQQDDENNNKPCNSGLNQPRALARGYSLRKTGSFCTLRG
jgi:hypothetical protein